VSWYGEQSQDAVTVASRGMLDLPFALPPPVRFGLVLFPIASWGSGPDRANHRPAYDLLMANRKSLSETTALIILVACLLQPAGHAQSKGSNPSSRNSTTQLGSQRRSTRP
jgi:hypothetical protein